MILLIFLVLGLIIGSFLNVVIYRLKVAESILGRSKCPHCKSQIRWYDNIPLLSFILLKGECRDCKEKISWQYPAVEFATGIMYFIIANYFFYTFDWTSWVTTAFYLIIFSLLLVIFVYDFRYMEIPMVAMWTAIGVAGLYLLLIDYIQFNPGDTILASQLFSGIFAGIIAFLFFFILSSVSREKWMGYGDAYLAFLVGLLAGWPKTLLALMLAFALGAIYGLYLIIRRKKTLKSQIPFAPFLILGIFLIILLPKIFPEIKYLILFFY